MIEKKRPRRRKSRPNLKRASNHLRAFDSKGQSTPRTRGALSKALEKYTNLAQDAFSNGDRIVAEGYYQYAEHYQRVLNEIGDDIKENGIHKHSNPGVSANEDDKPSRTQRALNAKNQKYESKGQAKSVDNKGQSKSVEKSQDNTNNKSNEKTFTSAGIEALKPFEI